MGVLIDTNNDTDIDISVDTVDISSTMITTWTSRIRCANGINIDFDTADVSTVNKLNENWEG